MSTPPVTGGMKCDLHRFQIEERTAQAAKASAPAQAPGISDESLRPRPGKTQIDVTLSNGGQRRITVDNAG